MRLRKISSSGSLSFIVVFFCLVVTHGKGNVFTYFLMAYFSFFILTAERQLNIPDGAYMYCLPRLFLSHLQDISWLNFPVFSLVL